MSLPHLKDKMIFYIFQVVTILGPMAANLFPLAPKESCQTWNHEGQLERTY